MRNEGLSLLFSLEKRKFISSFYTDCSETKIDGKELEWHREHQNSHVKREVMLILSGEAVQSLNGRCFRGTKNTVFLYDHYEKHDNGYPSGSRGHHLWIFMLPELFICNLLDCRNGNFTFTRQYFFRDENMIRRIENVWDEAAKAEVPAPYIAELNALLNLVFVQCYRAFSNPEKMEGNEFKAPHAHEIVNVIKNYLKDNPGKDSDINSLAHLAGYSRQHLMRLFREHTGYRIKEYVNLIRSEKYERIRDAMPVKEIAWELGFSSSAAFDHWKKYANAGKSAGKAKD